MVPAVPIRPFFAWRRLAFKRVLCYNPGTATDPFRILRTGRLAGRLSFAGSLAILSRFRETRASGMAKTG